MPSMVIVVEVVASGGGDAPVDHQLFSVAYCPPDPAIHKFLTQQSTGIELAEWRDDIIRPFPLDASDMTVSLFAPISGGTIGYPGGMREEGLYKSGGTWRWENRTSTAHREEVRGIPETRSAEGMVIGSAWFEFVREIKKQVQDGSVQTPSFWCIMGVEAMVENLRSNGLRPRVVFWMEGEKYV